MTSQLQQLLKDLPMPSSGQFPASSARRCLLESFGSTLKTFVDALDDCYEGMDKQVAATKAKLDLLLSNSLLLEEICKKVYLDLMVEYKSPDNGAPYLLKDALIKGEFEKCSAHFKDMEMCIMLGLYEKYQCEKDDAEFLETVRKHLENIINACVACNTLPDSIATSVEEASFKLYEDISSGKLALEDIDVQQLGEQILGKSKPSEADLKLFTKGLPHSLNLLSPSAPFNAGGK